MMFDPVNASKHLHYGCTFECFLALSFIKLRYSKRFRAIDTADVLTVYYLWLSLVTTSLFQRVFAIPYASSVFNLIFENFSGGMGFSEVTQCSMLINRFDVSTWRSVGPSVCLSETHSLLSVFGH